MNIFKLLLTFVLLFIFKITYSLDLNQTNSITNGTPVKQVVLKLGDPTRKIKNSNNSFEYWLWIDKSNVWTLLIHDNKAYTSIIGIDAILKGFMGLLTISDTVSNSSSSLNNNSTSYKNESVKLETNDGSIFVYNMGEVESITKQESSKKVEEKSTPNIIKADLPQWHNENAVMFNPLQLIILSALRLPDITIEYQRSITPFLTWYLTPEVAMTSYFGVPLWGLRPQRDFISCFLVTT